MKKASPPASYAISNSDFVGKIQELVSAGYGLTPFLGSGCSSPSGILMGQQFTDYLGYTVHRCLRDGDRWDMAKHNWPDHPSEAAIAAARGEMAEKFRTLADGYGMVALLKDGRVIQYVPKKDLSVKSADTPGHLARLLNIPVVPPFLRGPGLPADDDAVHSIQEHLLGKKEMNERIILSRNKSETSPDSIWEKALRSLSDWRAALRFLSMLRAGSGISAGRIILGEPDPSVIDKFHDHITRGKEPNLTHQMIAQLSMSARIRVVLTTNFDKLVEKAYEDFGRSLSCIPVSLSGGSPHPDLVHATDRLVKLHGDRHETRADYSLDDPPGVQEKDFFFHYVRGEDPGFSGSCPPGPRFIPSQLLVIGYSGSDRRCNDMIKYVLDADPRAVVYWICHSGGDVTSLDERFNEEDYRGDKDKGKENRIISTQTERPDLLLYDIYQKLNLTLPSPGTTYHFPDRVIPARPPLKTSARRVSKAHKIETADEDAKKIAERLLGPKSGSKGVVVTLQGDSGALTIIHQTFAELGRLRCQRIWLELEDYPDAASVGAEIRTALGVRTGSLPLGHMRPLPAEICSSGGSRPGLFQRDRKVWGEFFRQSAGELGITPRMWTIGLYGRNGAGGCSGWDSDHKTWEKYQMLEALINGLSDAGFNILYAPYTAARKKRDKARVRELRKIGFDGGRLKVIPSVDIPADETRLAASAALQHPCGYAQPPDRGFSAVLKRVRAHFLDPEKSLHRTGVLSFGGDPDHEWREGVRALFSATLFRQSRHFSAFITEAIYNCPSRFNLTRHDNDERREKVVKDWLDHLTGDGVFYTKPGGFAWAYRDIRLGIRHLIDTLPEYRDSARRTLFQSRGFIPMGNFASKSHFFIGEWYAKAHRVTRHTVPLSEGLYHFYQAIRRLPSIGASHTAAAGSRKDSFYNYKELDARAREVLAEKQKVLFFSSIIALLNLLRTGERSLRYWASVPLRNSMFAVHQREAVISEILKVHKKIFLAEIREKGGARKRQRKLYAQPGKDYGIDYSAWTLIDDVERELKYVDQRFSSEFRIVDIPFQKNIGGDNFCDYGFEKIHGVVSSGPTPLGTLLGSVHLIGEGGDIISGAGGFFQESGCIELLGMIHGAREYALAAPESRRGRKFTKDIRRQMRKIQAGFLFGDRTPGATAAKAVPYIGTPREINLFIQALVEWAFVFIRRAKKVFRARAEPEEKGSGIKPPALETPAKDFLVASLLCNMALDLCRLLPPAYAEYTAKHQIKAQSIYGLALGNLGRFREAHRRLGEARVLCRSLGSSGPLEDSTVLLGIAELRRAEVLCLEARECGAVLRWMRDPEAGGNPPGWDPDRVSEKARNISFARAFRRFVELHDFDTPASHAPGKLEQARAANVLARWWKQGMDPQAAIGKQNDLNRIIQAKIGDAWRCLEESRRCFYGRTHSPRWWGRQYALELRVFGEAGMAIRHARDNGGELECHRMLPFRNRRDVAAHLRKLWKDGLAVAGTDADGDKYYRIKITSIYLFALKLAPETFPAAARRPDTDAEDFRLTKKEAGEGCKNILDFLNVEFPGLRAIRHADDLLDKHSKPAPTRLFKGIRRSSLDLNHHYYVNVARGALRLAASLGLP